MTSIDAQDSYNRNVDNDGKRLDVETERFLSQMRGHLRDVSRGYVFYQTCKDKACNTHEAIIAVDPHMWHRVEPLPTDFSPWLPDMESGRMFAASVGLPTIVADMVCGRGEGDMLRNYIVRQTDTGPVSEKLEDFAALLLDTHVQHARVHGCPVGVQPHVKGTKAFHERESDGKARINNLFRVVDGCVHTDTDVLLVDPYGRPLFLAESYHYVPGNKPKQITFSVSLSAKAGGGLVALIREDGHVDGPLVEALWDTRDHRQFIGVSHGVRGYHALGELLLSHPIFAPYLASQRA